MSPQTAFSGVLNWQSPLRAIFPKGIIPLSSPTAIDAILGTGKEAHLNRVYFLVLECCSPEQLQGIAKLMHEMGQGTMEGAAMIVASEKTVPVRESNIASVGIPLRFII